MKGFILYRTNDEINGIEKVMLYGRLENGESFASSHSFFPYFFIKNEDLEFLKKISDFNLVRLEKSELRTFQGKEVIKLNFETQKHLNHVLKELTEFEVETFEADLKPPMRFMIDNGLLDYINLEGDYQKTERVDRFYEEPIVNQTTAKIPLKILSLDIESGKKNNQLFCVGIYTSNEKEVLMVTEDKIDGVISCKTERDCLEKLKERILEIDPDIIAGWNIIDFDFVFLKKLFNEHNISFDLGRNNKEIRLRIEKSFLKKSSMDIPGRVVLDGLNLIRDPFIKEAPTIKSIKFESYSLEEVAEQILKETKLIKGKNRFDEIEELYLKNQKKLAEYNLQDCKLVYNILRKTNIVELSMERANLTGMPLDKLTGSIANFDSLYIRESKNRGLVSPSSFFKKKSEKIKGGFVIQPSTGRYNNVLVLDFKSLYPSIIQTFNIDPSSYLEQNEKGCVQSPNGAFFKNEDGILPGIISRLSKAREKAKAEKRELSSYAIKIIMNSFFGVLASPNSRYFSMKLGNSITNFGQEIIKLTVKKIEELGYSVIYGDTDSIFINTNLNLEDSKLLGKSLPREINSFYKEYIKNKYHRESKLELEFDKLFLSFLIPRTRNQNDESNIGTKKRYAGLIETESTPELSITGLEAIRGDWTEIAQEFQKELLIKLFNGEDILSFIKEIISRIRRGEINKKLIYRKSIRKELKDYTKTTPPHVKAARKIHNLENNRIEYYITKNGPEPIQNVKSPIDYEHYIEKQIKPIATTILESIGIDPEKAFSNSVQKKLF